MSVAEIIVANYHPHSLRNELDYDEAIKTVEQLWGSEQGTPAGEHLDTLMDLVEVYENKHHIIDMPDPIEALKVRMEDLQVSRADLGKLLNASSGRVSEILNRNRRLTLPMIRTLAEAFNLSYDCLCQSYKLADN